MKHITFFKLFFASICLISLGLVHADALEEATALQDSKLKFKSKKYIEGCGILMTYGDAENVEIQGLLSFCFFWGLGVGKDLEKAQLFAESAAKRGDPEAQNTMGNLAFDDDIGKAKRWYELAAAKGHPIASYALGYIYAEIKEFRDNKQAEKFMKLSAESGYDRAQNYVGKMYEFGQLGSDKNYTEALKWYQLSDAQGFEEGSKALALLNAKLDKLEKAEQKWKSYLERISPYIIATDKKGIEIALGSKTKFMLKTEKEQITGQTTSKAVAEGPIGDGSFSLELSCKAGNLVGSMTLYKLKLAGKTDDYVPGRIRVNGVVKPYRFEIDNNWNNVLNFVISPVNNNRLSELEYFTHDKNYEWIKLDFGSDFQNMVSIAPSESNKYYNNIEAAACDGDCSMYVKAAYGGKIVNDLAIDLETNFGKLFIQMPPYDNALKNIITNCKPMRLQQFFVNSNGVPSKAIYTLPSSSRPPVKKPASTEITVK